MNKVVKLDLKAVQEAMESLQERLPGMTLATKVDVAARLRAVAKAVEAMDKAIKQEIKAETGDEAGVVPGEIFKANVAYSDVTRLDQKKLQVDYPKTYAKCLDTKPEARITFEPR